VLQVAVLRERSGRGGSAHVHDVLSEGSAVRVRGPRNHFALVPAARYVFIAGGIGITPILPMVERAEAAGAQWQLVYGGRTRSSMAFRDRLGGWCLSRGGLLLSRSTAGGSAGDAGAC